MRGLACLLFAFVPWACAETILITGVGSALTPSFALNGPGFQGYISVPGTQNGSCAYDFPCPIDLGVFATPGNQSTHTVVTLHDRTWNSARDPVSSSFMIEGTMTVPAGLPFGTLLILPISVSGFFRAPDLTLVFSGVGTEAVTVLSSGNPQGFHEQYGPVSFTSEVNGTAAEVPEPRTAVLMFAAAALFTLLHRLRITLRITLLLTEFR